MLQHAARCKIEPMKRRHYPDFVWSSSTAAFATVGWLLIFGTASGRASGEPAPQAVAAFNAYIGAVESRLAQQHRSQNGFLALAAPAEQNRILLRKGELLIEELTPSTGADLPGALLHHWRGTAFVPGATAADFERLMKNFNAYPQFFSPQVLEARVLSPRGDGQQDGDHFQALMRVRQRHVITVVMDTTYDIDVWAARCTARIQHLAQHADFRDRLARHRRRARADSKQEHGFLWRQNTYWSYEERDGGLYMQIESVSLTRSIPTGLGWAVGPFVESVPRESLEFTLRSASMRCADSLVGTPGNTARETAIGKDTRMNAKAATMKNEAEFRTARRVNQALTASMEKRALQWMAERAPKWVSSDQLTLLGFGAQIGAGVCYALSRYDRRALLLVILCLALNWLGDSLDGTLARVRRNSGRAMASMSITWRTSLDRSR